MVKNTTRKNARKSANSGSAGKRKTQIKKTKASEGKGAKPAQAAKRPDVNKEVSQTSRTATTTQRGQVSRSTPGANAQSQQAAPQGGEILVVVTVKNHMDSNGGHPHIIVENIDDNHVSVGLTTDKKKGKNHPNIKLERSPIKIKEGKTSYIRRQGTVDKINSYVEPRNGEITNGDYEKVKKIGEKAKNKYLSIKDKKNK